MNRRNMGKESRLRNPKPDGTRYAYTNGDRKLYDRDAMPDGLDSDIWSLTLLFEQYAETNSFTTPGRPIIYTELYNRVSKDDFFSELLRKDTSLSTRTRDTVVHRYSVLEDTVHYYWTTSNSFDYEHSINDYCSITVFNYCKDQVLSSIKRQELITTGTHIPQVEKEIKPSRRTEEEKKLYDILNKPRTEEEIKEKLEHWKSREEIPLTQAER
jgi:hypothetical protein